MKLESKRLFISDLPGNVFEEDLRNKFGQFGQVTQVEIKERKNLGPKNKSAFFAYINIDIDHNSLDSCFKEFNNQKFKGNYIELQLAKESFFDRLKKERQDASNVPKSTENQIVPVTATIKPQVTKKIEKSKQNGKIQDSSSETSDSDPDSSDSEVNSPISEPQDKNVNKNFRENSKVDEDVYNDIVVKNNKNRKLDNKIESQGKEPIIKIELGKTKSKDPKRQEADQKRINSMLQMKRGYQNQKLLIQAALSKVDNSKSKKIVFDENESNEITDKIGTTNNKGKQNLKRKNLFDEEDEQENDAQTEDVNFEVKKQFAGKKGQKLFDLQSRFNQDSRFQLDERFVEDDDEEFEDNTVESEIPQEDEKRKQLEILGEVLGTKLAPKTNEARVKKMMRFDPSQPEHSIYEIKEVPEKKNKTKSDTKVLKEPKELPKVSEDKFYNVADSLKDAFQESSGFSLLSMFGRRNEEENETVQKENQRATKIQSRKKNELETDRNPFKYDSSDDEDEGEGESVKKDVKNLEKEEKDKAKNQIVDLGPSRLWTESFFFKEDDYRFQEGLDFIKKLEIEEKEEFGKIRRDLKVIVQAKVKNNLRKNRQFKKKLGGSGHKKMIRVKRALKR